jgi:hypothetical protein
MIILTIADPVKAIISGLLPGGCVTALSLLVSFGTTGNYKPIDFIAA